MGRALRATREEMRQYTLAKDDEAIKLLCDKSCISTKERSQAHEYATKLVEEIRKYPKFNLMDIFMAEFGLTNQEGIALMCLAEALLRVPDTKTIDELIEDKIVPSDWISHLDHSSSSLINASTWALMLTGRILGEKHSVPTILNKAIKRIGEPIIRQAINRAMHELSKHFILGENIKEAIDNGKSMQKKGYSFSYDMLGEAACTADDALSFFNAYASSIGHIAQSCKSTNVRENPGISIKLSALFERYEFSQRDRVMKILVPRVLLLAQMAKKASIGLNIDAEEAARLELSMDIIEAVMRDPSLDNWEGFGIVVQAYSKRARFVIDWFYALAKELGRKAMLRLVKGAYWDTEIKLSQVEGLKGFPVFTRKEDTDISYLENASHLLGLADVVYPQFATHNAHSVAMIKTIAKDSSVEYEFQRLYGMGAALYDILLQESSVKCRVYAPVGSQENLLAYLVRRLLENGANSSFINQILNSDLDASYVARDPYERKHAKDSSNIKLASQLFLPRQNSRGWDLNDVGDTGKIEEVRSSFMDKTYHVRPLVHSELTTSGKPIDIINPATGIAIGDIIYMDEDDTHLAIKNAKMWDIPTKDRCAVLRKAADIYEQNFGEVFAILAREAGKTLRDAVAELREAVDFLRYYADEAEKQQASAQGVFVCISPWNFPLAIFTGQIAAALAAGNGVLAKPAEATSIIAMRAVQWLHEAGVPHNALQFLPGTGSTVGNILTSSDSVHGVCFTGSMTTAQRINRNMAEKTLPGTPFIAETGGLNAMIVDSTARPEQAIKDIIVSAFQSAGQRCSALRVLYIQDDIFDNFMEMLLGAIDALVLGDPWQLSTDIGPVIDARAHYKIRQWIARMHSEGRVIKESKVPDNGFFVGPTVIKIDEIQQLEGEVFGPVLHVARYSAKDIGQIIEVINATGYGLTFGMHSRIDSRIDFVAKKIKAGNIYINRNQIGAIVGSQPFGGQGLSGTGPKAGGPLYLHRFYKDADFSDLQRKTSLPCPTGESNQWCLNARKNILCLGPSAEDEKQQAMIAEKEGCNAIKAHEISASELLEVEGIDAAVYWGKDARKFRKSLVERQGPIIPLITAREFAPYCWVEKHICIDTTSSGGNVELLNS